MSPYDKYVEAVGKLILKGIWWSDAIQIVHIVLGPMTCVSSGYFQRDVDEYVDKSGERVPKPKYKNIF